MSPSRSGRRDTEADSERRPHDFMPRNATESTESTESTRERRFSVFSVISVAIKSIDERSARSSRFGVFGVLGGCRFFFGPQVVGDFRSNRASHGYRTA